MAEARPGAVVAGRWHGVALAGLLAFVAAVGGCGKAADEPGDAEVRKFLNRYFSTWSNRDMDGYGACFHPQARILFVTPDGTAVSEGLTDFLHGQRLSHAQSPTPMTEVPTDMKITLDRRLAQAVVRWKLTKGAQEVTGTDCFTLVHQDSGWKIMSLVFYND